MDLVERVLLKLAHMAAVSRGAQASVVLIPIDQLLLDIFGAAARPDLLRQCARQLAPAVEGDRAIEIAPVRALLDTAERHLARDPEFESRLHAVDRVLDQLLAVCLMSDTAYVTKFEIPLSAPGVFGYIQKIQPAPARGQPVTTILGTSPGDVTISFDESDADLSRIELRYTSARRDPLLNVYRRSFSRIDDMVASRHNWQQKATEHYDLEFAETGRIYTRVVQPACAIQLGRGTLSILESLGVDLIATKIISPNGVLLAECIRVVEQHEDTTV